MRLIANKPCSFGGRKFYIGDEIPENLVADARAQEKMGVITIVNDGTVVSDAQSDPLFTQEQTDRMIAEAVNSALLEMEKKQGTLPPEAGVLMEAEGTGVFEGTIPIAVMEKESGESAQGMEVPATPEEIQQVFSILQMNAEEGARAIAEVADENVLILLHAADSRKTVRDAARKQADKIFSTSGSTNESTGGNAITGTNTEGADT